MLTINHDHSISVGTTITGYSVAQMPDGTIIRRNHNHGKPVPRDLGEQIALPKARYTLSTEQGRAEFERDFLAAYEAA